MAFQRGIFDTMGFAYYAIASFKVSTITAVRDAILAIIETAGMTTTDVSGDCEE
ncbi:MAG: hypothetical protein U1E97_10060 [Alphaproteobacteria bacterium]